MLTTHKEFFPLEDSMNDLTLQKARAYEAEHGAAISPAERPAYHMTPMWAG